MLRRLLMGLWVGLLCGMAAAQAGPTIESFTVDNDALPYPDVEGGTAAANFRWRAVGLREGDRMFMHAWVGGQWVLIGEGFAPEKTDRLVIAHPLDFIPPRYRLSVVDAAGAIAAEQILDLRYAPPDGPPAIPMFLAFPPVSVIPLSAFDAPFRVQWQVSSRPFNSHIVFEQVLPDGTVVNVEHPGPAHWQYAHATGYLKLVYPGDHRDVVLRLRVVDRDSGTALAEQTLVLHVDNPQAAPAEVRRFEVTPTLIEPGATVTLAWDVANTDAVFVEYEDGNPNGTCAGNLETLYELAPSGSLEVRAPDIAYAALRFRLFADYHVPGSRHHCGSFAEPLAETTVELTDYVHQGVEYFRIEPSHTLIGAPITLSWSVSEGESVTITYPNTGERAEGGHDSLPVFARYTDLPLTGSLEVTMPDTPAIRSQSAGWAEWWLYIIEDGRQPAIPDASATVILDRDGSLNCEPALTVGEVDDPGPDAEPAGGEIRVTWDSCGNETLLRLALVTGGYGAEPVSEEFVPVASSGTTTIRLPESAGTFYIQLYYAHADGRYMLRSSPLTLELPAG